MNIKMRIKHRKTWLFIIGAALLLILFFAMSAGAIIEENDYSFLFISIFLAIVVVAALFFRFNYGLFINEKRVIAIDQSEIKILKYDDVSTITVRFTDDSVSAYIKMKSQEEHAFVWAGVFLGYNLFLPSENKISINEKFVEKSIKSLSRCPKVKIQNFYTVN